MLVIHHHSYVFRNIKCHIGCSALDLYPVSWKHIPYFYGDVIYPRVEFEHFPLKGIEVYGMQSKKIFDIDKVKYRVIRDCKINIAEIVLEQIPIVVFIEIDVAYILIRACRT